MITPQTSMADLLDRWPQAIPVLLRRQMSCVGCSMAVFETLESAAQVYHLDLDGLICDIQQAINASENTAPDNESQPEIELPPTTRTKFMNPVYTFFQDLASSIESIPSESIVSRTIYRDDQLKAIVFAFAPGQELSEHTASVPAMIQILEGECELTLGSDRYEVKAGAWAHMPAKLPHSILAHTPVKMLLLMQS